jgi:hypothetical protein
MLFMADTNILLMLISLLDPNHIGILFDFWKNLSIPKLSVILVALVRKQFLRIKPDSYILVLYRNLLHITKLGRILQLYLITLA